MVLGCCTLLRCTCCRKTLQQEHTKCQRSLSSLHGLATITHTRTPMRTQHAHTQKWNLRRVHSQADCSTLPHTPDPSEVLVCTVTPGLTQPATHLSSHLDATHNLLIHCSWEMSLFCTLHRLPPNICRLTDIFSPRETANFQNCAAYTRRSRTELMHCSPVCAGMRASLCVWRDVCLPVRHGGSGVTACFGERLHHSPHWQADMLLKQMVPTEHER